MRKANHVIHGSIDDKFERIHRFYENLTYGRLATATFCQLLLAISRLHKELERVSNFSQSII